MPRAREAASGGSLRALTTSGSMDTRWQQSESRKGTIMKTKLSLLTTAMFLAAVTVGLGQSTLQFVTGSCSVPDWASSTAVPDWAGPLRLVVQRTKDLDTEVSVDYATAEGTAIAGLKYTATNGTLVFAPGETNQTIVVQLLDFNEGLVETTQAFDVILSNPTNAVLGAPTRSTVSILNVDVGIQFQFADYSAPTGWPVPEDVGTFMIGVVRGDDANGAVSVDFATSDGTGISGVDYIGLTNTLSFAPTERLKFVPVTILNNTLKQPSRTFKATLSNPAGVSLRATQPTTVTVLDNDQGFQFETNRYEVAEDAGVALIAVLRGTDDTNATSTVNLISTDNSAIGGLDYTGLTDTLTFGPGERRKEVPIPILNDGVKENLESFKLTLSNPSGAAALGSPTTATVYIRDNDPGVGFEFTGYTNAWGQGVDLAVNVVRGNDDALGPITVDYATSDMTAKAGTDYQAVSGTLTFAENETIKRLSIPLLRPRAAGSAKNFRVTLRNPTGGATLGTATTTVSIQGLYATVAPPFDTALTIRRDRGVNILTWTGGGPLQRADKPTGPWQTLANASSPWTVQSPVPMTFYRVTRPQAVKLYIPSSYDGQTNAPLVLMLPGYYGDSDYFESVGQIQPLAEARGFLYCHPPGPKDLVGDGGAWNATDAVSDFYNRGGDDAGYLRALIEEIGRRFAVDRKRVHLVGIFNGGFMAYRVACDSADLIAGIASVSGATYLDPGRCHPSEPVNILHIHATDEELFFYFGGALGPSLPWPKPANMPPYPGALQTIQTWAAYNGARDSVTDPARSMEFDPTVPGLDTVLTRYTSHSPGGAVELWSIVRGKHNSENWPEVARQVIDWLLDHPKP
ncbi:MAG: hypothetical protein FJ387_22350 [Verrucomicrobia bacterium]|nr:hypothetical protein [Verrucomicrobiota bacterium]